VGSKNSGEKKKNMKQNCSRIAQVGRKNVEYAFRKHATAFWKNLEK